MKMLKKVFLGFFIGVIVLFIAAFFYIKAKGKTMLQQALAKQYNTEVSIGSVRLSLPLAITVTDFNCGDVVFSKARVALVPGFAALTGAITIARVDVDGLRVVVGVSKDAMRVFPFFEQKLAATSPVSMPAYVKGFDIIPCAYAAGTAQIPAVRIGEIALANAVITVRESYTPRGADFVFNNVRCTVKNFAYPQLTRFDVQAAASLTSQGRNLDDVITAEGFIDMSKKDMDITARVNRFDYFILSDYYVPQWQPAQLGLAKGIFSIQAHAKSVANALAITGAFLIDEIDFQTDAQGFKGNFLNTAIALAPKQDGKPALEFEFHTRMDAPVIDVASFKKQFENNAQKVVNNAVGEVISGFLSGDKVKIDSFKNLLKIKKSGTADSPAPEQAPAAAPVSAQQAEHTMQIGIELPKPADDAAQE